MKTMGLKAVYAAVMGVAVAASSVAMAEVTIPGVTVSGSAAYTSNYKFRGEDQTAGAPTVQAALNFGHSSGAYLNTWASGISGGGQSEFDVMLGYAKEMAGGKVDVGVMRYIYPNSTSTSATELDFNELYASYATSVGVAKGDSVKVATAYSNEYNFEAGDYFRVALDYSVPVAGVSVLLSAGYNDIADSPTGTWLDYKAAVSTTVSGVGVELAYAGLDGDYGDALSGTLGDGKAILTLSKGF